MYEDIMGIDLGTTFSAVGVIKNGIVEIIENENGNLITSSCVSFDRKSKSKTVGDIAKKEQVFNPENTIDNIKRLMGRCYNDPEVQEDKKHLGYDIVEESNKVKIRIIQNRNYVYMEPEQVSSMILLKLKEMVYKKTKKNIRKAVITIPNHFNHMQRQATLNAAKIADIEVIRLIKEPSAAALTYSYTKKIKTKQNVIVYDFGGGTLDVSLIELLNNEAKVLATSGDTHLGGENLNQHMVNWFISDFEFETKQKVAKKSELFRRFHSTFERCKKQLSFSNSSRIDIHDICEYIHDVYRAQFEAECLFLFKKTMEHTEKVLVQGKVDKNYIDKIILVGGSTRIPKIRELLRDKFGQDKIDITLDPDTSIAYGATLQSLFQTNSIMYDSWSTIRGGAIILTECIPLSMGVETIGGKMCKILNKNMPVPAAKHDYFTTVRDYQRAIAFDIYEGERVEKKFNHLIGSFVLRGIQLGLRGIPSIWVKFEMNENFKLNIMAKDTVTKSYEEITIDYTKEQLSDEKIAQLKKEAETYKEYDKEALDRINSMVDLDEYVYSLKRFFRNGTNEASWSLRDLKYMANNTDTWLKNNPFARACQYKYKKKALEALVSLSDLSLDDLFPKRNKSYNTYENNYDFEPEFSETDSYHSFIDENW